MMKDNSLLTTSVTIVLVAAGLSLLAGFLFFWLEDLSDEIIGIRKDIFTAENQKVNFLTTRNLIQNTKSKRSEVDAYFIEGEEETVQFLETLEGLGKELGVTLSINVGTRVFTEEKEKIQFLTLDITATGPLYSIYNYLFLLENYPAKFSFNSVNIKLLSSDPITKETTWSGKFIFDLESFTDT